MAEPKEPRGPSRDRERQRRAGTQIRERQATPPRFKVVLYNDDYTPMEFVVQLLEAVFDKSPAEAYRIMMQVHTQGRGLAGVYPFDVAETRVARTEDIAESAGYPLKAVMEQE
jgi:ATP-dependent Clp protease adaptor protein ClpS